MYVNHPSILCDCYTNTYHSTELFFWTMKYFYWTCHLIWINQKTYVLLWIVWRFVKNIDFLDGFPTEWLKTFCPKLSFLSLIRLVLSWNLFGFYLIIPSRTQQIEPKARNEATLTSNFVSLFVQISNNLSTAPYWTNNLHKLLPSRAKLVITLRERFSSVLAVTQLTFSTHVLIWTPSINSTTLENVEPISVISLMRGTFWRVGHRVDSNTFD